MKHSEHYNFGVETACGLAGVSAAEFAGKQAYVEALEQSPEVGR